MSPHRRWSPALLTLAGLIAAISAVTPPPATAAIRKVVERPLLHLTWHEPYGSPRATTRLAPDCSNATGEDTLFLTFETPKSILHYLSISGALVFEPLDGDTLGSYWDFERGGQNSGNILIGFDPQYSDYYRFSWEGAVEGHVGYTRAAGRGRLDISVNGPNVARGGASIQGQQFLFARVIIVHTPRPLTGCNRPMKITWVAARFPSRFEGDVYALPGARASVTWNAPRGPLPPPTTRFAPLTWLPQEVPPSRKVLETMRGAPTSEPALK
jgi:hypothetical protein